MVINSKKYKYVHCIGDSHANTFHGICNDLICVAFGPNTMHTIGKLGIQAIIDYLLENKQIIKENFYDPQSLLILAYGEIDVRCHINKQVTINNRDEDEVILTLSKQYIDRLIKIREELGNNIAIMSIVPPMKTNEIENIHYSKNYPFVGSDEIRNRYTKKLNNILKKECELNNILYLDVYNEYCDGDGFLLEEFSDGNVHILNRDKVGQLLLNQNILTI